MVNPKDIAGNAEEEEEEEEEEGSFQGLQHNHVHVSRFRRLVYAFTH